MTTDDLAWTRAEVGAVPDDATLNANYDRLGMREKVALEIWKTRYADFLRNPADMTGDGFGFRASYNLTECRIHIDRLTVAVMQAEEAASACGRPGFVRRPDRFDFGAMCDFANPRP